ncbi:MAG: DNA polymerase III subunit epsilon [Pseudomonadota bacterium]|nr:DNA polymerase III subunit epsilon [Pseudomonadota bacterium]
MSQSHVVVLDTETTGLDQSRDRVIEIGAIKLLDGRPVSKFHAYLNPQGVDSHPDALAVHGIANDFLLDKPTFEDIHAVFLEFVAGSDLVIHNAPFDVGFLDAELERVGYLSKISEICQVIDTLVLAKKQYPGQKNNLDALCRRFGISISHRSLHGALLDADLLVKVYLQMCVDQSDLLQMSVGASLSGENTTSSFQAWDAPIDVIEASQAECLAHDDFLESIQ